MSRFARPSASVAMVIATVACSGRVTERADAAAGAEGSDSGAAVPDTMGGVVDTASDVFDDDVIVIEGGTDCERTSEEYQACCNGVACTGQCVKTASGRIECRCYSLVGGCGSEQVCCWAYSGCTAVGKCLKK
ncbi:MAG: hypothetical protein HYV09_16060 [Deltaproteobacteria bacterium]|nr:hypothetical protein [Deltaproteobacteria bacterium]